VNHNTQKYLVFSTFYKTNLDSHKHNWLDKYLSFLASRTVIVFVCLVREVSMQE